MTNVSKSMKCTYKGVMGLLVFALFATPGLAFAALEVSGWIPYWRSERGVNNILPKLSEFTEVNPFFYTVKQDGTLYPNGSLTDAEWARLKQEVRARNVRFIPTVMWANADAMHTVFSDPEKRARHVKSIAQEVYAHGLDGIDIDYEARFAKTRDFYTLFHQELYEAIGYDKWIMCTLQSRTPLDSRYSSLESIPTGIEYANDFTALNSYCDRIRIMAYDQGRIDLALNKEKGHPYIPVADTDWVRKTMELIAQEVDRSKLVIGVPTYGYEYDMFDTEDGRYTGSGGLVEYSRLWSFNPGYATEVAAKLGLSPTRNSAGELMLTYPANLSPDPTIPLPHAQRVMTWSDAEAIRAKAKLAEELGLRGIALFKIDDGQDPLLFNVLAEYDDVTQLAKTVDPMAGVGNIASITLPKRDLEYGMRHEDVRTLQQFLNQEGYTLASSGGGSPGNETTFFGPATRAALSRFQAAHGIRPSVGYYGPITRATIARLASR